MDMSALETVLQAAPGLQQQASGMMGDSFIFGAITAVSVLLVTVCLLRLDKTRKTPRRHERQNVGLLPATTEFLFIYF